MTLKELKYHRKLAVEKYRFMKDGKEYWKKEIEIITQLIDEHETKNTINGTGRSTTNRYS